MLHKPDYSFTGIKDIDEILQEISFYPSTLETIDEAMFKYVNEDINISTETNEGRKKVPVIWSTAELSSQIKNNPELRDDNGVLKYPIISLSRENVTKDRDFKGSFQAHFPEGPGPKRNAAPIARRIVPIKTNNFARVYTAKINKDKNFPYKNERVVYQTVYGPIPTYVKAMYSLKIKTNYISQLNEIITPFFARTGQFNNFFISANGHRFEGFIEGDFSYSNPNDLLDSERVFDCTINLRILGYVMGENLNDIRQNFSIYENVVEVKIPRDHVILEDNNITTIKSFYRS